MPRIKKTEKPTPVESEDVIMLDENDELPELIDTETTIDLTDEASTKPVETKPAEEDPNAGMKVVENRKRRAKNRDVFMRDVEEKQPEPSTVEPVVKGPY
jgi:hypothetical protein